MATNAKRAWSQPELIVIVRGRPEEAVLASCKGNGTGVSNGNYFGGCQFNIPNVANCVPCQSPISLS